MNASSRNRYALLAATTAAAMLSMLPTAASAQSAPVGPAVPYVARTHDANNAIALQVAVAPYIQARSITATIILPNGTAVGTVPAEAFHQAGTDVSGNTLWQATPTGLAANPRYFVTADVTDAEGNHSKGSGDLFYGDEDWFVEDNMAPETTDWVHQTVTLSGKVIRTHPDGTLIGPVAGKQIVVKEFSSASAVTAEDGTYRITVGPQGLSSPLPSVQPCIWEPELFSYTQCGQDHHVGYFAGNTRITLDKSALSLVGGKSTAVTGRVDYFDHTAQGWKPLAGMPVRTTVHNAGLVGRTDTDGRFSIAVAPPTDVNGGSVSVVDYRDAVPAGWYLKHSTAKYTVDVHDQVKIGITGASIGADGLLTLRGTAKTLSGRLVPRLAVQYSADNRTWKNIGAFDAPANGNFTYRKVHATPRGYWRISLAANGVFTASTSPVKHLVRTATRITTFNAAPEPVVAGRPITVSGNLQRQSGSTWTAFANQKVGIYFQVHGSDRLAPVGYAWTDSRGHFSKRFTAQWDGAWRAVYRTPSGAYLDTLSGFDTVYVDH
ncbi:hypothetical protein ACIP9H_17275 [Streptomyces sp. NPDC088732]|uniref:hypothetical protein n=1 Tax=Streptomyces sp. NPDC088732 TaxID=3365879 RepID=UPI003820BAC0